MQLGTKLGRTSRARIAHRSTSLLAALAISVLAPLQAQRFADLGISGYTPDAAADRAFRFADVNGDGYQDVLTASDGNRVALFYGRPDGGVVLASRAQWPPLGAGLRSTGSIRCLELVDVDRDGDLDALILAAPAVDNVRLTALRLNDGKGKFRDATAQLPARSEDRPGAARVLDADGDGDLDVLFSGWPSLAGSSMWRNDGSGRFVAVNPPFALTGRFDGRAAWLVLDVDEDGDQDVLSLMTKPSRLFLNLGRGRWRAAAALREWTGESIHNPVVLDFDRDGDLDVVSFGRKGASVIDEAKVVLSTKNGLRRAPSVSVPIISGLGYAAVAGDVDGDSWTDVVLTQNFPRQVLWSRNLRGTGFSAVRALPEVPGVVFAAHDIDRDGDDDLLASRADLQILPLRNVTRQFAVEGQAQIGGSLVVAGFASSSTVPVAYLPWVSAQHLTPAVAIPGFGVLGVDPTTSSLLPPLVVPSARGAQAVRIPVPQDPRLRGTRLYFQSFVAPDARLSSVATTLLR